MAGLDFSNVAQIKLDKYVRRMSINGQRVFPKDSNTVWYTFPSQFTRGEIFYIAKRTAFMKSSWPNSSGQYVVVIHHEENPNSNLVVNFQPSGTLTGYSSMIECRVKGFCRTRSGANTMYVAFYGKYRDTSSRYRFFYSIKTENNTTFRTYCTAGIQTNENYYDFSYSGSYIPSGGTDKYDTFYLAWHKTGQIVFDGYKVGTSEIISFTSGADSGTTMGIYAAGDFTIIVSVASPNYYFRSVSVSGRSTYFSMGNYPSIVGRKWWPRFDNYVGVAVFAEDAFTQPSGIGHHTIPSFVGDGSNIINYGNYGSSLLFEKTPSTTSTVTEIYRWFWSNDTYELFTVIRRFNSMKVVSEDLTLWGDSSGTVRHLVPIT